MPPFVSYMTQTREVRRARSAAGTRLAALQFLLRRRVSEIVSGEHEIGPDAQSLLGRRDGLVPIPHGLVCGADAVIGLEIVRFQQQRLPRGCDAILITAGAMVATLVCYSLHFQMAFRAPAARAAQQPPALQVNCRAKNASTRAGRLIGGAAILASANET